VFLPFLSFEYITELAIFPLAKQNMILVKSRNLAQDSFCVQAEMAIMKNDEAAHSFEKVFVFLHKGHLFI